MASPTQWTCVWVHSRSWWWTGRPDVLQNGAAKSWTRLSSELKWTECLEKRQLSSCVYTAKPKIIYVLITFVKWKYWQTFLNRQNTSECLLYKKYWEDRLQGAKWGKVWRAIQLNRIIYIYMCVCVCVCIISYVYVYMHVKVQRFHQNICYYTEKILAKDTTILLSIFLLFSTELFVSI